MEKTSGNDGHTSKVSASNGNKQQEAEVAVAKEEESQSSNSSGSNSGVGEEAEEQRDIQQELQEQVNGEEAANTKQSPHEISVQSLPSTITSHSRRASKRCRRGEQESSLLFIPHEIISSSVMLLGGGVAGLMSSAAAASNVPYRVVAHIPSRKHTNKHTSSAIGQRHQRKLNREQERRRMEHEHQREFAQQVSHQLLELERTFNEAREQASLNENGGANGHNSHQHDATDNHYDSLPAVGRRSPPSRSGYDADEEETSSSGEAGK